MRKYLLQPEEAASDARLLTVLGPPGIGKTRLSQQIAVDLAQTFADGGGFVAAVCVHEAKGVASAIAQAFELQESGGQLLLVSLKTVLQDYINEI